MKLHVEDLTGITSAMCRLGYLDDAGQPTASFWEDMAMREADDLVEGYQEVYGEVCGLEVVRDLMAEFLEDDHADALQTVLAFMYERSGTEQPECFSLLDGNTRTLCFCDCLLTALNNVLV